MFPVIETRKNQLTIKAPLETLNRIRRELQNPFYRWVKIQAFTEEAIILSTHNVSALHGNLAPLVFRNVQKEDQS